MGDCFEMIGFTVLKHWKTDKNGHCNKTFPLKDHKTKPFACGAVLKPVQCLMTKVLKKVGESSRYKMNLSYEKSKRVTKMLLQGAFVKRGYT